MIVIDIPAPKNCEDCPCSYYVQTGEYAGMMMCNAMEFKRTQAGFIDDLSRYFVVAEDRRPDGCPIVMVTV